MPQPRDTTPTIRIWLLHRTTEGLLRFFKNDILVVTADFCSKKKPQFLDCFFLNFQCFLAVIRRRSAAWRARCIAAFPIFSGPLCTRQVRTVVSWLIDWLIDWFETLLQFKLLFLVLQNIICQCLDWRNYIPLMQENGAKCMINWKVSSSVSDSVVWLINSSSHQSIDWLIDDCLIVRAIGWLSFSMPVSRPFVILLLPTQFLSENGMICAATVVAPNEATEDDLLVVHSPAYLESLRVCSNCAVFLVS